jgi:zinc transporter ZupT
MVHNLTEGLGIAAPAAERGQIGLGRVVALALIAGAAIVGAGSAAFSPTISSASSSSQPPPALRSRSSPRLGDIWFGARLGG